MIVQGRCGVVSDSAFYVIGYLKCSACSVDQFCVVVQTGLVNQDTAVVQRASCAIVVNATCSAERQSCVSLIIKDAVVIQLAGETENADGILIGQGSGIFQSAGRIDSELGRIAQRSCSSDFEQGIVLHTDGGGRGFHTSYGVGRVVNHGWRRRVASEGKHAYRDDRDDRALCSIQSDGIEKERIFYFGIMFHRTDIYFVLPHHHSMLINSSIGRRTSILS